MKSLICTATLIIVFLIIHTASLMAQDPNLHIYLCFGQSNMDGTGAIEAQDRITNDRVKMLQDQSCSNLGRTYGTWYTAAPPLSRCWNGLGPSDYFGKEMASNTPSNVTIGLVVTGYGGCDIAFFQKGAPLGKASYNGGPPADIPSQFTGGYAWMLDLARKAQTVGVIKGIIFHQGETNTGDPSWKYKVQEIVNDLRTDLGIGNVPFLAGELLYTDKGGCCGHHNPEINKLPEVIPNCEVVSASGLAGKDNAHFNSASYRELGIRYAKKMLPLVNTNNTSPTVAITVPNVNSSVCIGTSVKIEATATISSGSISKVDFYDGNVLLGTVNSSPYVFTWENPSSGIHTLRAIATSSTNIASSPATVSFTVNSPTAIKPVMQLNGAAWGDLASAKLCEGGDLGIGPHPYDIETGWSWTGPAGFTSSDREIRLEKITPSMAGIYSVSFINANGCKSSLDIPVTVYDKPIISIVSPFNNEVFYTSTIPIDVNVNGPEISNVQYYNGNSLLGQNANQPYNYIWNEVPAGSYSIQARAITVNGCSDTVTSQITVTSITGFSEEAVKENISFYPSPFHDYAILQAKGLTEFSIVDITGNIVEKGIGENEMHIGKTIPQGTYFLRVCISGEDKVFRITKEATY
jgi:hypothetical protein